MKKYSLVIFDLDGTIIDSSEGITSSVQYALDKRGYPHGDRESLKIFIGPPLREQFMKYCGITDVDEGTALVSAYRENYSVKGIYQCSAYDGIIELLCALRACGCKAIIATSKPERFAKIILDHLSLTEYFDFVGGANLNNTRTDKAEVIDYALKESGFSHLKNDAVMIGDCVHDIIGAKANGLASIAVTYGFGDIGELQESGADFILNSPYELKSFLCDN